MEISLLELNYKDEIEIDEIVTIPKDLILDTEIIKLDNVKVIGSIKFDVDDDYLINLSVSSKMFLHDALTFDEVPYDFVINIEEKLENSCKSLDLIEFLWHYIVLEIPLRFTVVDDESLEVKNDDYQVISEEEYKNNNNPFKDFFKE